MRLPFSRKKESAIVTPGVSVYFPFPVGLDFDPEKIAREGYQMNGRVYAAIRQRATACAGIPWLLYKGEDEIEKHPILMLLEKPNRYQSRASFIEEMVSNLDIYGNNFIEGVFPQTPNRPPAELYNHSPKYIEIIPGTDTKVERYKYERGVKKIFFTPDNMLHQKTYHPNNDFYGLSPIAPAAVSIDQNNQSKLWNLTLLRNGARVGGVLFSKSTLTDKDIRKLKEQMKEEYSGSNNAGLPMVLEGEFEWQPMTLNAQDIDWTEGQKVSGREIALAFLMPPEMLGDSDTKTYSNYQESRKAFYIESVLPTMDKIQDDFNWWLCPKFGDGLRLEYNRDEIEALSENRGEVWDSAISAVKAGILTINEARAVMQYDDIEGGDELSPQPDNQFNLIDNKRPPEEEELPEDNLSKIKLLQLKKKNLPTPGNR
jgi:HK97 family phage portal protein